MGFEINPTTAVIISTVMTGVFTPVVAFALTEYRLTRQRRWDEQDRRRIAVEATAHLDQVHLDVKEAGSRAEAAYCAANAVNLWRNELTQQLISQQDKAMLVAEDTNSQVRLARSLFLIPAIAQSAKAAFDAPKKEEKDGKHPDVD